MSMNDNLDESPGMPAQLVDLAMLVAGGVGFGHLEEDFENVESVRDIEAVFSKEGIRWGRLVEHDVTEVLSGRLPQYFLSEQEWVALYRSRRSIPEPPMEDDVLTTSEQSLEVLEQTQARRRREISTYGVTTDSSKMGWACAKEQQYFYGTPEWNNRASAARFVAGSRCERCGARDARLCVHHIAPIISAYHHNFDSNFADYSLVVLCEDCHKKLHGSVVRGTASLCFIGATQGEIDEYRAKLRKLDEMHNRLKECPFCQDRVADKYPNP
jgi:hypothetical protein